MELTEYHSVELITLSSEVCISRKSLHAFLKKRGFIREDDFYFVDRRDRVMPWQSISILTLYLFRFGVAVLEAEDDIGNSGDEWNELKIEYLLATLPCTHIARCASECEALATEFDLEITFNERTLVPGQLQSELECIAVELARKWDEPGSEALAILIEQSYGSA